MNANISRVEKELHETKQELQQIKDETNLLKKAIWDMLNYSDMYFLVLDKKFSIKLINYRLAKVIGFESEKDAIGENWLQFIHDKDKKQIKNIHSGIISKKNNNCFNEKVTEVISKDGLVLVKWFNVAINSHYNVVMSFGLPRIIDETATDESVRTYYAGILKKDKTMIEFLKEKLNKNFGDVQNMGVL